MRKNELYELIGSESSLANYKNMMHDEYIHSIIYKYRANMRATGECV